ncbi:MAG: hypothetical protein KDN20_13090 [Verrucomicrobiae bacterium]|nr:hypothetical protein [Verrucomicrobiae bacterium]
MNPLTLALYLGAAIHFGILSASALTPRALNWRETLAPLPPLLRRMFWVYGVFIVLIIICFAILTLLHAPAMAAGEPVARSVAAVIAIFWTARLLVQAFVFDARPWLTRRLYRIGYHLLTVAFIVLVAIYGCAALGLGERLPLLPLR